MKPILSNIERHPGRSVATDRIYTKKRAFISESSLSAGFNVPERLSNIRILTPLLNFVNPDQIGVNPDVLWRRVGDTIPSYQLRWPKSLTNVLSPSEIHPPSTYSVYHMALRFLFKGNMEKD